MKSTSVHIKNKRIKQLCNHKVWDFATTFRARKLFGTFEKRAPGLWLPQNIQNHTFGMTKKPFSSPRQLHSSPPPGTESKWTDSPHPPPHATINCPGVKRYTYLPISGRKILQTRSFLLSPGWPSLHAWDIFHEMFALWNHVGQLCSKDATGHFLAGKVQTTPAKCPGIYCSVPECEKQMVLQR